MASNELWGLVLIGVGMFVAIYGNILFRFAIAAMGFGVGMIGAFKLFADQDDMTRLLVALGVGGIAALLLFTLVQIATYVAGAVLGVVGAIFLIAGLDLIGLDGLHDGGLLTIIITVAGLGVGGFFGPRLGDWITILATAGAGAYMIMAGLQETFSDSFQGATEISSSDPVNDLTVKLAMAIFLIIAAISAIGQHNYRDLRRRVLS